MCLKAFVGLKLNAHLKHCDSKSCHLSCRNRGAVPPGKDTKDCASFSPGQDAVRFQVSRNRYHLVGSEVCSPGMLLVEPHGIDLASY